MEIIKRIVEKVIEGNMADVESLTNEAVEKNEDVQRILDEGFTRGLDVVGEKYTAGEFFA